MRLSGAPVLDTEPPPARAGSGTAFAPRARVLEGGLRDGPFPYRHVLLLRFVLVNAVAVALLGAAWVQGWVGLVLASDASGLVVVIATLFLFGLGWCAQRVWRTTRELDQVRASRIDPESRVGRYLEELCAVDGYGRATLAATLRLKLASRIAPVRHIASALVVLGLVGTVIGFIIALSGVDPQQAADPGSIAPMVSTLIQGMSVALYTTLVGAVLNVWLMLDYRLLEGGTTRLFTALVEEGERHASA
jgi:hypothetical protein